MTKNPGSLLTESSGVYEEGLNNEKENIMIEYSL